MTLIHSFVTYFIQIYFKFYFEFYLAYISFLILLLVLGKNMSGESRGKKLLQLAIDRGKNVFSHQRTSRGGF